MSTRLIYTIGYSGYGNNPELLISELKKRGIDVLIDVRSNPYSAQFNGYNKEWFEKILLRHGVQYRNYAEYFGAKQKNNVFYSKFDGQNMRIDYDIFARSTQFKNGVNNMIAIVDKGFSPVIMCSEKDPMNCHRAIMVARVLFNDYGFAIEHIVPDTKDESQADLEKRMVETITNELEHKKKLNSLEQEMKEKIIAAKSPSFFTDDPSQYLKDINNYYRIINSRIGWTREEVLGYK
ncbi:DUF488 domain-containing protein [Candidatus Saccharibacteria bacterium]|nr:DUF488 domain-containing protein [Candidatus Saccharibacteria bacterium]